MGAREALGCERGVGVRERCWGAREVLGRRRKERGGTYGRRIEAGEESRLWDGENLWCSALPSPHLYCVVGSAGWVV